MTDAVATPADHSNEFVINQDYVLASSANISRTATVAFAGGELDVDLATGAPVQFHDRENPKRVFLLEQSSFYWHSIEHQWGSGHIVTDRGSARWNVPLALEERRDGSVAEHTPVDGLRIVVERRRGTTLTENYTFSNEGPDPLRITGLGIQTPFADVYQDAQNSLETAVHTHVFAGGRAAWALAQPMSGDGRLLGLIVREGGVHSYSVESRNRNTQQNVRGHLVLQVTDQVRNPEAFGGQPTIILAPGESYILRWEISWFDDVAAFEAGVDAPARFDRYSAEIGSPIRVVAGAAPVLSSVNGTVHPFDGGYEIRSNVHGPINVEIDGMRTELAFHLPLPEIARRRIAYILDHQGTPERPGLLAHALVPVDTRTLLTQSTNGWSDWSDGSERIGMPILIQLAAEAGWIDYDAEIAGVLDGWAAFAKTHLLDKTAAPRRGSQFQHSGPRLYDSPWLAQFFHDRYRFLGDPADLDLAAQILERAFELGGGHHLSIQLSETCIDVAASLEPARADRLLAALVASARIFIAVGTKLPGHEVNFEQSMIAPLINILSDAYAITGEAVFLDALRVRLPWLLAFGGPQPHVRLNGIAIRHWDGYWFGIDRLWGDIFPHYWSALTATALLRLPIELRSAETDALAATILRANTLNYNADGSATCAFVMPSSVDGRPAHSADPLANDQDWHLSIWLRAQRMLGEE